MDKEEISKYAIVITYSNQRTILKFKDGRELLPEGKYAMKSARRRTMKMANRNT